MKKVIMAVAICMIGNPTFAQDCDYVKIVQYENGKIVNSKTEYVCESPPTIIVNYLENKKKKKPHWSDNFKPIRVGHSPDPTGYYGNYDTNLLSIFDFFKVRID